MKGKNIANLIAKSNAGWAVYIMFSGLSLESFHTGYLKLQECIQSNVGSSIEADQVLNLMENTRRPEKYSIIISILFALCSVFLAQIGLYIADIITDALVVQSYYIMWRTSDTALDCRNVSDFVIRYNRTMDLADYRYCLTSQSKFVYSVTAILLPSLSYIAEDARNSKKLKNEDIPGEKRNHGRRHEILYEILRWIIIILFPLWPLFIFLYKTYPLVKYNWRTGTERRTFKRRLEKICLMVLMLHSELL